jgi:hypothetical protein
MNQITRTSYGEIVTTQATRDAINGARAMATQAAQRGKIPAKYDDMEWGKSGKERGKRIGNALYHEVYDFTPNGRKALICVREVEGDRYGQKTTSKTYYIVAKHGAGVRVTEAPKAIAAKAAKGAGELGQAIEVCEGKAKLHNPAREIRTGYKFVTRNDAGELVSVWDGSAWALGVTRSQGATSDHSGGFYYYATKKEAVSAANESSVFGNAREHHNLVLVEVSVTGREFRHGAKRCATHITPVLIVAEKL